MKITTRIYYTIQQEFRDYLGCTVGRYESLSGAKSALRSLKKNLKRRKPKHHWPHGLCCEEYSERKKIVERLRVVKQESITTVIR